VSNVAARRFCPVSLFVGSSLHAAVSFNDYSFCNTLVGLLLFLIQTTLWRQYQDRRPRGDESRSNSYHFRVTRLHQFRSASDQRKVSRMVVQGLRLMDVSVASVDHVTWCPMSCHGVKSMDEVTCVWCVLVCDSCWLVVQRGRISYGDRGVRCTSIALATRSNHQVDPGTFWTLCLSRDQRYWNYGETLRWIFIVYIDEISEHVSRVSWHNLFTYTRLFHVIVLLN